MVRATHMSLETSSRILRAVSPGGVSPAVWSEFSRGYQALSPDETRSSNMCVRAGATMSTKRQGYQTKTDATEPQPTQQQLFRQLGSPIEGVDRVDGGWRDPEFGGLHGQHQHHGWPPLQQQQHQQQQPQQHHQQPPHHHNGNSDDTAAAAAAAATAAAAAAAGGGLDNPRLKRNKPVKWSAEEDRRLRDAVVRVSELNTIPSSCVRAHIRGGRASEKSCRIYLHKTNVGGLWWHCYCCCCRPTSITFVKVDVSFSPSMKLTTAVLLCVADLSCPALYCWRVTVAAAGGQCARCRSFFRIFFSRFDFCGFFRRAFSQPPPPWHCKRVFCPETCNTCGVNVAGCRSHEGLCGILPNTYSVSAVWSRWGGGGGVWCERAEEGALRGFCVHAVYMFVCRQQHVTAGVIPKECRCTAVVTRRHDGAPSTGVQLLSLCSRRAFFSKNRAGTHVTTAYRPCA